MIQTAQSTAEFQSIVGALIRGIMNMTEEMREHFFAPEDIKRAASYVKLEAAAGKVLEIFDGGDVGAVAKKVGQAAGRVETALSDGTINEVITAINIIEVFEKGHGPIKIFEDHKCGISPLAKEWAGEVSELRWLAAVVALKAVMLGAAAAIIQEAKK